MDEEAGVVTTADEVAGAEEAAAEAETTGKTTRIRPVKRNRHKTFPYSTSSKKSCPEMPSRTRTRIPGPDLRPRR